MPRAPAYYRNRNSTHKEFKAHHQVFVLIPDSSHKRYARWAASATLIEKKLPYSYFVQLPENNVQYLNANKVREIKVQTTDILRSNMRC